MFQCVIIQGKKQQFSNIKSWIPCLQVYGVDRQVPDSAQTATALMGGVKTNLKVIGYNENVQAGICSTESQENKVNTILDHFIANGNIFNFLLYRHREHSTNLDQFSSFSTLYPNTPHKRIQLLVFITFNNSQSITKMPFPQIVNSNTIRV